MRPWSLLPVPGAADYPVLSRLCRSFRSSSPYWRRRSFQHGADDVDRCGIYFVGFKSTTWSSRFGTVKHRLPDWVETTHKIKEWIDAAGNLPVAVSHRAIDSDVRRRSNSQSLMQSIHGGILCCPRVSSRTYDQSVHTILPKEEGSYVATYINDRFSRSYKAPRAIASCYESIA